MPELADVLSSLVLDASCWDNARTFEDFCDEFGYDPDSRSAERIYEACGKIWKDLREVCGREFFAELLALGDEDVRQHPIVREAETA